MPAPNREPLDLLGSERLGTTIGEAPGGTGPKRRTVGTAHPKSHESAAIVQVQADPIPTIGAFGTVGARPFVIHPGTPAHRLAATVERHLAVDLQLWSAVIVAGVIRVGRLAAEALVAIEHGRPSEGESEVIGKVLRVHAGDIVIIHLLERPVIEPDMRPIRGISGTLEARAGGALIVTQATQPRVGDGRMGQQQLAWSEGARVVLTDSGAHAKEGDLKAERIAVRPLEPTGHIPPFGTESRVSTLVVREAEDATGEHGVEGDIRAGRSSVLRGRRQDSSQRQAGERQQTGTSMHHQSSRTASTASWRIACRPASTAARLARPASVPANTRSDSQGTLRSMLQ